MSIEAEHKFRIDYLMGRVVNFLLPWLLPFMQTFGSMMIFVVDIFRQMFRPRFEVRELILQLYAVGVRSVPVVFISGLFVGAIVALQFHYALNMFGATIYLGGVTTSGLLREVGPVLVAIMITGRVGAYITAELGTMKVTDQVDAIRCLGVNPVQYLIVPRFIAVTTMIFMLTIVGVIVTLVGGALVSYLMLHVEIRNYLVYIRKLTTAWALLIGMIKGLVFGLIVAVIACHKGINTQGGAEGVGRAVNSCLVTSAIAIFLTDYAIASLASLTYGLAESVLFK